MTKAEEFAENFESAVRDAFVGAYGPPPDKDALQSIRTSWSKDEIARGWHNPDPRVVVVGTEYAWVRDPHSGRGNYELWERVVKDLTGAGWGNVGFESINAAVHIVFIDVPRGWYPKR